MAIISLTWSGKSPAAVVTSGCANKNQFCTVDELALGANMVIGDKLFHNWSTDDASTVAPVNLSLIRVFPLDDQALNPGIEFLSDGALVAHGLEEIYLGLAFQVSVVSGSSRIVGSSLALSGFEFSAGNIGGIVAVSSDILAANGVDLLAEQEIFATPQDLVLLDSLNLAPQAAVRVEANILLSTGRDPSGTVVLNSFEQRFAQRSSPIPEPPSLAILGLGLFALWGACRRSWLLRGDLLRQ